MDKLIQLIYDPHMHKEYCIYPFKRIFGFTREFYSIDGETFESMENSYLQILNKFITWHF